MEFVHVATRTMDLEQAIAFYEALGLRLDHKRELTKNRATLAFMAKPDGDFAIELVYNWGRDTPYEGRLSAADRAAELALTLLAQHEVAPIDEERAATLERIIASAGL